MAGKKNCTLPCTGKKFCPWGELERQWRALLPHWSCIKKLPPPQKLSGGFDLLMSSAGAHAALCSPTTNTPGKGELPRLLKDTLGCGIDKLLTSFTRTWMQRLCLNFPLAFTPHLLNVPMSCLSSPWSLQGLCLHGECLWILFPVTLNNFFLSPHAHTNTLLHKLVPFGFTVNLFSCFLGVCVLRCSAGVLGQEILQSPQLHHASGTTNEKDFQE